MAILNLIQTTAAAFGTFASPSGRGIIYVDPNHDLEQHHSPVLTPEEAREAYLRGLIEDPDGAKAVKPATGFVPADQNDVGVMAAERTGEHAKLDEKLSPMPSALPSRESTAWPDAERVRGGAEGYADGNRGAGMTRSPVAAAEARGAVADEDDADAPPAPAQPAAKPAAAKRKAAPRKPKTQPAPPAQPETGNGEG